MFVITYTTNLDDRHKVTMTGKDKTDAYLNFVRAYPGHYIITELEEIINV
jgi:hypothetical protein